MGVHKGAIFTNGLRKQAWSDYPGFVKNWSFSGSFSFINNDGKVDNIVFVLKRK